MFGPNNTIVYLKFRQYCSVEVCQRNVVSFNDLLEEKEPLSHWKDTY